MQSFYVLNEEQKDLYFDIIKELPDEIYNVEEKDIEILNSAINSGSKIEPVMLARLRNTSVFARILKEIKKWHDSDVIESHQAMPAGEKKRILLAYVDSIIQNNR